MKKKMGNNYSFHKNSKEEYITRSSKNLVFKGEKLTILPTNDFNITIYLLALLFQVKNSEYESIRLHQIAKGLVNKTSEFNFSIDTALNYLNRMTNLNFKIMIENHNEKNVYSEFVFNKKKKEDMTIILINNGHIIYGLMNHTYQDCRLCNGVRCTSHLCGKYTKTVDKCYWCEHELNLETSHTHKDFDTYLLDNLETKLQLIDPLTTQVIQFNSNINFSNIIETITESYLLELSSHFHPKEYSVSENNSFMVLNLKKIQFSEQVFNDASAESA